MNDVLRRILDRHRGDETDVTRVRALVDSGSDPWARPAPLHVTGSALVVHPPTQRVLLHWHVKLGRWLQLGGHGEPGEDDPAAIALREATEESGLADLRHHPHPDTPTLLQVVVVPVPAFCVEPAHDHADLRYLLATDVPLEAEGLRWLTVDEALALTDEENLRVALRRVIFTPRPGG